jgi:hypothetical protein
MVFNAPDPSDTGGVGLPLGVVQAGGDLPGFRTAARLAARTPEWAELANQWQAQRAKDFNDRPVGTTVGVDGGQRVVDVTGLDEFL